MKIYIDPGHGGKDPGATGNGITEAAIALDISLRLRRILRDEYGATIRMSRTTDVLAGGNHLTTSQSLSWRVEDARKWGANLFVSVHLNAGGGNGFESYRHSDSTASAGPQRTLHSAIMRRIPSWSSDRGRKHARFTVLTAYRFAYAVLTENLFVDHKPSADWLKVSSNREALARGHAEGIAEIANLSRTSPAPQPPPERTWFDMATEKDLENVVRRVLRDWQQMDSPVTGSPSTVKAQAGWSHLRAREAADGVSALAGAEITYKFGDGERTYPRDQVLRFIRECCDRIERQQRELAAMVESLQGGDDD